jgi:transcriptional antiterminator NusG
VTDHSRQNQEPENEFDMDDAFETDDALLDEADEASEGSEEMDDGREWYVVHCYSGMGTRVKRNLEHRIESMAMGDRIFAVVVPTEEQIELKDGERRVVERRVFPGYILVQMILDDDSWSVVRNTPGVTGFVGIGNRPTPLSEAEVDRIMSRIEASQPRVQVDFKSGD